MPTKSKRDGLSYLYDTARWQRLRRYQLQTHPLCAFCLQQGEVEPATIVDHIEPHRDDINRFWTGRLQSLCAQCHNRTKQQIERKGFYNDVGLDGWPLDPRHPVYQHRSGS
jgi:5-methylcytosine-specific restriction protein A